MIEQPGDLGRGEIGIEQKSRLGGDFRLMAGCVAAHSQTSAVRRSCQTIALWIGSPLSRSHMTVVSR